MRRYAPLAILAGVALLTLLLSGVTRAQAAPQDMTITLSEFSLSPDHFTATQGQPIRFTVNNIGKFPHSVSFVKDGKFLTVFAQPIAAGQSGVAEFTFEEAGSWTMYCPVSTHAERGMTGTVTVLTTGAPGMPTTGQPLGLGTLLAGLLAVGLLTAGLLVRRRGAGRPT